jgi:hypothetical protein
VIDSCEEREVPGRRRQGYYETERMQLTLDVRFVDYGRYFYERYTHLSLSTRALPKYNFTELYIGTDMV